MRIRNLAALSVIWLTGGLVLADDPKPDEKPKARPVSESLIRTFKHPQADATISQVQFTADGRLFTAGYPSGIIQFFNIKTGEEAARLDTPSGYRSQADYAYPTPDFRTVYVVQIKQINNPNGNPRPISIGQIEKWDVATGKIVETIATHTPQTGILDGYLSRSGDAIVTVENTEPAQVQLKPHQTILWDLKTKQSTFLSFGYSMADFSHNGKWLLVTNFGHNAEKGRMILFDRKTGKELWNIESEYTNRGYSWPVFLPDDQHLVALDSEGQINKPAKLKYIETKTGKVIHSIESAKGTTFMPPTVSPDGTHVVVNKYSGGYTVWNVITNKIVVNKDLPEKNLSLRTVFSHDGKMMAALESEKVNDQAVIRIYDVPTFREIKEIVCPPGFCHCMAFAPDGKSLAAGCSASVNLFKIGK
ncbi:MAG: WD40 repeat domain-containing protein [Gemmataceae bacterium]